MRLAADDYLEVQVRDGGRGLPDDFRPGIGVTSMRERTAELGGSFVVGRGTPAGTRVLARLPLERP